MANARIITAEEHDVVISREQCCGIYNCVLIERRETSSARNQGNLVQDSASALAAFCQLCLPISSPLTSATFNVVVATSFVLPWRASLLALLTFLSPSLVVLRAFPHFADHLPDHV